LVEPGSTRPRPQAWVPALQQPAEQRLQLIREQAAIHAAPVEDAATSSFAFQDSMNFLY
jgi:hypothetical protein